MRSRTIKNTGISDELLALLDACVRSRTAAGRSAYVRELIRQDAANGLDQATPEARTFRDILAPIHEATRRLGYTDAEIREDVESAIRDYRRERVVLRER